MSVRAPFDAKIGLQNRSDQHPLCVYTVYCVLLRIGIITSPYKRSLQLQLVCFATKPLSETGSQRPCNIEGVRWIQRSWGGEALKQLQAQSGSEKSAAGLCMTEDKFP